MFQDYILAYCEGFSYRLCYEDSIPAIAPQQIMKIQGLQILLISGVTVTSASQILESFWNIWSQVSQRKKPFSDFPAHGPGMYTLSWRIHKVALAVR